MDTTAHKLTDDIIVIEENVEEEALDTSNYIGVDESHDLEFRRNSIAGSSIAGGDGLNFSMPS